MQIEIAENAGFCFGVLRAVNLAHEHAKITDKLYTLGDIIHNKFAVLELRQAGVLSEENLEKIPNGSKVLIRAHGVGLKVYEKLHENSCEVIDATCPFVKKIHEIVTNAEAEGSKIFVIGEKKHPEIIGISGYVQECQVFSNCDELEVFTKNNEEIKRKFVTIVMQTTLDRKNFIKIEKFIKKEYTNAKIFDTICRATNIRQNEVLSLAERNDAVIVIGDVKSSNTKRLYEISKSVCENSFLIESACDLEKICIKAEKIGITAGASTPASIIKEVKDKMSNQEQSFEEMLNESFKTLNTGDKVTGTVIHVAANEIQVDLGVKHSGYIAVSELSADPTYDVFANVSVGDKIESIVVRVNDVDGVINLSKKRIDAQKTWDVIEDAFAKDEPIEGTVIEENKGGVMVNVEGVRVFVPASLTGVPRGEEMSSIMREKVKMKVLEVSRHRRRVLASIRAVKDEVRKEAASKVWETIKQNEKYTGVVKSITSYGAFVDIGGVDGMVHVSELSWNRIKNPADVLKVGQEIEVYVLSLDAEKRKISLGYKDPDANPWKAFEKNYEVGDIATVKIVKLMPFGAFAQVIDGVDGLIHISQISEKRIVKPDEVLSAGQEVDAKIIEIDSEKQKVSLSIRAIGDDSSDFDSEDSAE
ncbi:MAG: bifunctional 4-hydroxy-3-methylbut-2-enyl diphosphate reductase/30S ribosomal protein S1 [Clostridia bacterium]